jgi:DNA-directed RNA polymerase subunit L
MTCGISLGTGKESGMYSAVSTGTYGMTPDVSRMDKELQILKQKWKDDEVENIEFEAKNWRLLEGLRFTKKNSFDFIIETIGVYTNKEIFLKACDVLINKLSLQEELLETGKLDIIPSPTTMEHSFDIILVNEDYTIGKAIEYFMFTKFVEGDKTMTFCGFIKIHPHDTESIIRIAYNSVTDMAIIKQNLKDCIKDAAKVFKKIAF